MQVQLDDFHLMQLCLVITHFFVKYICRGIFYLKLLAYKITNLHNSRILTRDETKIAVRFTKILENKSYK